MVRHEAAEALGGIATPEVFPYLKEYMTREDAPVVVRESCQVALDVYEVRLVFIWNASRIDRLIPITVRKFGSVPVCQWFRWYAIVCYYARDRGGGGLRPGERKVV
jgi:hypothetical protein